ncbi:hypothetical protein Q1Z72_00750 [Pseudomonas qingdaonensis]|jgi:hypothetical protein|uniref:hypothetical protein n=1 Tax=Pseudomonas TaxID=286 RepID=UPI00211923B8|nr:MULTISPECIES: hypothetical protein [Pseudomonas]UXH55983.1 hypothetical protein N5876_32440 [Pseudomonas aeruginosa]UXH69022.1 hypothetical protein N5879_32505 [Pseudomonas aeruginosa]WKL67237.1 hypothetical protein Q1Z72_00750 [Pseudomonas qingdaonensis]
MPQATAPIISRGTLIAALILFLAGAATGAAITIWRAEPAASEADEAKDERYIPKRNRVFPRRVDVV